MKIPETKYQKKSTVFSDFDWAKTFFWVLFFLGAISRIRLYFANLSLWNDEAALALNFSTHSFAELLHPLENAQMAPIGFCFIERFSVIVFGDNEFALRLFPLLAGITVLPLMYLAARRAIGATPALICLALIAGAKDPIRYSAEVKPYSVDLAITLALLLIALFAAKTELQRKHIILLACVGMLALWLSFPSVFVLGGIGCVLGIQQFQRKQWGKCFILGAIYCIWFLNFYLQFHFLHPTSYGKYLQETWSVHFMPFPPCSLKDLQWFLNTSMGLFQNPLRAGWKPLSIVMLIVGFALLWRKDRTLFTLLLLPLGFNLSASALKQYPFGDRLFLYGIPFLIIPISFLIDSILKSRQGRLNIVGILLLIIMLASPSVNLIKQIVAPRKHEEFRPVLSYISKHRQRNDAIYVVGRFTFFYYCKKYDLCNQELIFSEVWTPEHLDRIQDDLSKLREHSRVWLLFGHGREQRGVNIEERIVAEAAKKGLQVDYIEDIGASAYLFKFARDH